MKWIVFLLAVFLSSCTYQIGKQSSDVAIRYGKIESVKSVTEKELKQADLTGGYRGILMSTSEPLVSDSRRKRNVASSSYSDRSMNLYTIKLIDQSVLRLATEKNFLGNV